MKIDIIMWFILLPFVLIECLIRGLILGFKGFLFTIGEMLESIEMEQQ